MACPPGAAGARVWASKRSGNSPQQQARARTPPPPPQEPQRGRATTLGEPTRAADARRHTGQDNARAECDYDRGCPARHHRGAARHYTRSAEGDHSPAQCRGLAAAEGDRSALEGAAHTRGGERGCHTVYLASASPAQADLRGGGAGVHTEGACAHRGGRQEGIASRRYSSPAGGGGAPENGRKGGGGGYGVVLPARPYRDRDLADTGMVQLARHLRWRNGPQRPGKFLWWAKPRRMHGHWPRRR